MIVRNRLWRVVTLLVATGVLLATALVGCAPAEKEPIIFADLSWDSAQVNNRIAAFILSHGYGYDNIEYIPGDTITILQGLRRGDVHVNMEVWVENQQEPYDEAIAAGDVLDLGNNFGDNWQGWLVPRYMVEGDSSRGIQASAPDLRSVFDMPDYWELFKDAEDPTKGRFVNSIPGWECTEDNSQKLLTYGLDAYYVDFITGSDAALSGSLAAAYTKGESWFGYYWAPTWVLGKYDMYPLEEPPFDPEVWKADRGCAYPSNNVNVAVNAEFAERNPDVVAFLDNFVTQTAQHNNVLAYMEAQGATTEEAAKFFLKEYEDWWTKWVSADVAAAVKASL
ncbi:MAG: ABC transporter substrate-binding protein [Dehalococcoidia bacterium]|nr:ABC transporter substrate-binding protein [Dehalococcoidia bacterium]